MLGWLLHVLGVDNPAGRWQSFWSGFGSDLNEFVLPVAVAGWWRRHNCHAPGCWRLGRLPVGGTPWTVCARHHPHGPPTRQDIKSSGGGP